MKNSNEEQSVGKPATGANGKSIRNSRCSGKTKAAKQQLKSGWSEGINDIGLKWTRTSSSDDMKQETLQNIVFSATFSGELKLMPTTTTERDK